MWVIHLSPISWREIQVFDITELIATVVFPFIITNGIAYIVDRHFSYDIAFGIRHLMAFYFQ